MAYLLHVLIMSTIFIILAFGLNLVVGQTGLLSVAHAGFFGIGAYASAILLKTYHAPFAVAFFVAVVITGFAAFLIGLVLSGLRGDYYALGSLGFHFILYGAMLNLDSVTRGPLGIAGIPSPSFFGWSLNDPMAFFIFCCCLVGLAWMISWHLTQVPFGRVLKAIREDEAALQVFGYRTLAYKLAVFVLAGMLAAVAGVLYATYIHFVDPSAFVVLASVNLLAMIILGGLATLRGSFAGGVVFIFLYEAVRFIGFSPEIAGQMRAAVVGLCLLMLMMFRPQGLFGEYKL